MKKLILIAIISLGYTTSHANSFISPQKSLLNFSDDTIKKREVINETFHSQYLDLAQLSFTAEDSVITDAEHNIQELFGKVILNYGQIKITANYIKLDKGTHMLYANGTKTDATFVYKDLSDNTINIITASSLVFDLNNKKGDFFNAVSTSTHK